MSIRIKQALISVSDKTGLDTLIPGLLAINPKLTIYSTGGTFTAIEQILGPKVAAKRLVQVSDYTGQPETQGGLVKTLDFKVYLGLLTEKYNKAHQADLKRTAAVAMDLVVVNLYPFQKTVARKGVTVEEARANIDIGGPCMIRAAAKNYLRVASLTNPADYPLVLGWLQQNEGYLCVDQRFELARRAFAHTADYDRAIAKFLGSIEPKNVGGVYNLKDAECCCDQPAPKAKPKKSGRCG